MPAIAPPERLLDDDDCFFAVGELVAPEEEELGVDEAVGEDVAELEEAPEEVVVEYCDGTGMLVDPTIGVTVADARDLEASAAALAAMMFLLGFAKLLQQTLIWLAFLPHVPYSDPQHHVVARFWQDIWFGPG